MNGRISFATLHRFLLGLDFVDKSVKGSHHWLERPASGTVLVYRPYQPGDFVSRADLISTRQMLEETGVLNSDRFEQGLHGPSAA
jgi:hypothetical protein